MKQDEHEQCEGNGIRRDKEREEVDGLVTKENGNGGEESDKIVCANQIRLIGTR